MVGAMRTPPAPMTDQEGCSAIAKKVTPETDICAYVSFTPYYLVLMHHVSSPFYTQIFATNLEANTFPQKKRNQETLTDTSRFLETKP